MVDIIWLYYYTTEWWNTRYLGGGLTLRELRFWTLLFSYFLLIFRLVLTFFVFKIGNTKIVAEEGISLSNHYNKNIRNDDFMIEPSFSEDRHSDAYIGENLI